jgi:hypothetical protein
MMASDGRNGKTLVNADVRSPTRISMLHGSFGDWVTSQRALRRQLFHDEMI